MQCTGGPGGYSCNAQPTEPEIGPGDLIPCRPKSLEATRTTWAVLRGPRSAEEQNQAPPQGEYLPQPGASPQAPEPDSECCLWCLRLTL